MSTSTLRRLTTLAFCLLAWACQPAPERAPAGSPGEAAGARVKALADEFVSAYFDRSPESATLFGVPGRHHDKLTDNSLDALKAWETREDALLNRLRQIDPARISPGTLRATYAIARQALEGDVAKRICRDELWPVSQMTGWQVNLGYLVTIQPVGTDEARREAIARWSTLPAYIDREIVNLREGIGSGYTSPKLNVRIVIDQVRSLARTAVKDSPFGSPAQRDTTPEFKTAFTALVSDQIQPAMMRYADFLEKEYLPAAREAIAVAAQPNGAKCYDASVLYFSSIAKTAKEVHELGLRQNDELATEMKAIGRKLFNVEDVPTILQRARTDPAFKFKSREEKIAYSQAALQRAKEAVPGWFGLLPKADVVIRPYPAFREKNAPNEYNPPAEDGSRPAVFFISAYQAEKQSRVVDESTAFHETIPGHHLQGAIALERKDIHPIGRYLSNSGYAEGWALYAERVADEMKLFSSDLDRLGMLSSQALRASRLVVDSGLHTLGWTRQQAIDYMMTHTAETPHDIEAEVDRYIIYPGQATSYMIGKLEISEARREAEASMGNRFDIKAFHDRVLEDGGVPISYLREKIKAWAGAAK
ncbi:MAG TPA: DUF885 domain-containing protein [Vicinamibacterales bacterium]